MKKQTIRGKHPVDVNEITIDNINEVTKNLPDGSVANIGDYVVMFETYVLRKEKYVRTIEDIPEKVEIKKGV